MFPKIMISHVVWLTIIDLTRFSGANYPSNLFYNYALLDDALILLGNLIEVDPVTNSTSFLISTIPAQIMRSL